MTTRLSHHGATVIVAIVIGLVLTSTVPVSIGSAAGPPEVRSNDATRAPAEVVAGPTRPISASSGPVLPVRMGVRQASSSGGKATIEGRVRYQNATGSLVPSPQTDVIIRKRTALPTNKKITTTRTNDSGYYSVRIDVANWESNIDGDDTLQLRVQALAQNPAVNVVNFGKNLNTANGNTWTVNNDGSINRGDASARFDFTITTTEERRAFQIANWTLEEYRFTRREVGWTRKRVKARYPAAKDDNAKFKSFLEKFVIGANTWDRDDNRSVIHHEYGHAVMSGLFGYKGWQIPHTSTWFASHCLHSETHRLTAWYEGWAAFMEAATVDDPGVHARSIETHPYFNTSNPSGTDCPSSDTGDLDGVIVEGAIANILWDVYDPANEPHDTIDGTLGRVFDAVNETDNKAWGRPFNNGRTRDIHMFFIQYVDNTGQHEALRKIYFEYGINKPDRFEHDPGGGAACTVAGYPCSKLSADKWSKLTPNTSVDVGLHHQDDDFYRLDLDEEQRATINATVTAKAPDGTGDLRVVVSGSKSSGGNTVGPAIGMRTENYPNETVTFTAPDNGTYYVHVYDESSRTGGDLTYELTVTATPPPPQTFEQDDTRNQATVLSPYRIGQFTHTIEETASTARHDDDYFAVSLNAGQRIRHAEVTNGPGLQLTLENTSGAMLQQAGNGEVISTTTELQGTYYFKVGGDARVNGYTLNVTTQDISQKYEENDARSDAADLDQTLDLTPDPTLSGGTATGHRGSSQWCKQSGSGSSTAGRPGSGTGIGGTFQGPCPRHYWWDDGTVTPGYGPHEQDWYTLTLNQHERLNVTIPDARLGVELYADGQRVASTAPGTSKRSVDYTATTPGPVVINVTGEAYIPAHDLRFVRIDAAAHDRFEANDKPSSATRVNAANSGNLTVREPLLSLANGDVDYFAVDLAQGDTLNASLTHLESAGTVRLTVIDPSGSVTTGSDPRPQVTPYTTKLKRATVSPTSAGTHLVKVSGSPAVALKYNLSIRTHSPAQGPVVTPIPMPEDGRFEFEGLQTGQWVTEDVPTPEEIARAGMFDEFGIKPDVPIGSLGVRVAVRGERPAGVPALDQSPVLGEQYLTVESEGPYEGTTRIVARVPRDRLEAHDASAEQVVVFRHEGSATDDSWERLETTVVESSDEAVVVEGVSMGMSVYAVGLVPDAIYDLVANNQDVYNRNVDAIPDVFGSLFGGERIALEVTTDGDTTETVGVVMKGKRIQSVRQDGLDNPTLKVQTSEATIREIQHAAEPTDVGLGALSRGEITYQGVGIVNGVKYTGVKVVIGVLDFVGDTLGVGPFG